MMGMFSTVIHQDRSYQFKTGFDYCQTFAVGDRIPWQPDPRWPGSHIDGVHDGYGDSESVRVVVCDHRVVAVEPWSEDPEALRERYNIQDPDRGLWSEEQWEAKTRREQEAKEQYQEWLERNPGGTPVGYFVHCKLQETSIMGHIFPERKHDV